MAPTTGDGGAATEDVFYAFGPTGVSIIEPASGDVLGEIATGDEEIRWGDNVVTPDNRYVFANVASGAETIVIDTEAQEIVTWVEVGPGPVHLYHPLEDEIWAHADGDGTLYAIDREEHTVVGSVKVALGDRGHGKLTFHEGLGSKGYGTCTIDPGVHVIDLHDKEHLGFIEFEEANGTHAQRYNPVSGHAYFEITYPQRSAVVNVEEDTVETTLGVSGKIYNTPDEQAVVWADKVERSIQVLDAETEEFSLSIPIEGIPDRIRFAENSDGLFGFTASSNSPYTDIIDFDRGEIAARIEVGDCNESHRRCAIGSHYFGVPGSTDELFTIVDTDTLERVATVTGRPYETAAYVGQRD